MKILVDYENLPRGMARSGLEYLADRILTRTSGVIKDTRLAGLRLYGAWDRNGKLTTHSQALIAEIQSKFPKAMRFGDQNVTLTMELARGLEISPRKVLENTLRAEPVRTMRCQTPSEITCRNESCPLDPMAVFFNTGRCPVEGCLGTPQALLSREEQKMVDTMMVADLVYLATQQQVPLVVVSSDDDMWPGILTALGLGATVIHLRDSALGTQTLYSRQASGKYTQLGL